jgi:hypothetical protein
MLLSCLHPIPDWLQISREDRMIQHGKIYLCAMTLPVLSIEENDATYPISFPRLALANVLAPPLLFTSSLEK